MQQFFYDAQIERFLAQFIRMVSGFQVEFGADRYGNTAYPASTEESYHVSWGY